MNLFEFIKNPLSGNDLLNIVQNAIHDNEIILTEIQKDQWSEGKDKEGNIIGYYKPYTEKVAKESGINNKIAGEPYNLNWTGDLFRTTSIGTKRIQGDVLIEIDSSSPNLLKLFDTIEKHGLLSNPNTIFGYENKKKNVVVKLINDKLLTKLKSLYGL